MEISDLIIGQAFCCLWNEKRLMGFFALITLLAVLAGVLLLWRALSNLPPGEKKMFKDLEELRMEMQDWIGGRELVPLKREEMDAFSLNQVEQSFKKRSGKKGRGIFTTIYHEPVMAYSFREYSGNSGQGLLFVQTAEKSYSFVKGKSGVRIAAGNTELGTLKADGILYSAKNGKPLARLGQSANQLLPVVSEERELGSITLPGAGNAVDKGLSERAFQFVPDNLSEEERDVFLSLAALELVKQARG